MGERLFWLLMAGITVGVGWSMWRLWTIHQMRHIQKSGLPERLRQLLQGNQPAVLYFTSEGCVQCRMQQAPALQQLQNQTGIPVHQIDAVTEPDLASYFSVMTVPSTVVIGRDQRPTAINYGLAPLAKLQQQLESLSTVSV